MIEAMAYTDPRRPIDERVQDLLPRMTLEEKAGQMCQMNGRCDPEKWLREQHVGSFLHMLGPETNALQRLAAETRLGIPLLFGIDAIHGNAFWPTATVFPSQLGLSCSWNPALLEEMGRITAKETALTGAHWTFSPMLDTARDLRWGRIDETFGEDPYLTGVLGSALVRGYQGDNLADPHAILACAKHYAGYSGAQGGRDAAEAELTERSLRSIHLRPFHAAVQAGCSTIMTAYQAIDGVPCTANRWLLRDVLREEWGFAGMVVTDWGNVDRMVDCQRVSATVEEAAQRAVEAGNDMSMFTAGFPGAVVALVESGKLDVALVDEAVERILRLKFALGLFDENRYADLESGAAVIGCDAHRAVALNTAYESIVLLENRDGLLPLGEEVRRIAVIGPNADDIDAQLGDWVLSTCELSNVLDERSRESVVTVLDGIRHRAAGRQVDYRRGCDVLDPGTEGIAEAAELAREADVAIVVVGDDKRLTGEGHDRASLDLTGAQQQLLEAVHATGTPMVVVLINSKPLTIPWVAEHAHAVLVAWNPGVEGGTAVAGILFGDRNPSGKLTISFPHHVGQQPSYYNQLPGWHGSPPRYIDMPRGPLYAFGYGLSYTRFAYSNLRLSTCELAVGENLVVEVDVENIGQREGTEVVQLYVNDVVSSVTTPIKELKTFARVDLVPGEKKTVRLDLPHAHLALIDGCARSVVEPGKFNLMVGGSSRDEDLLKSAFEAI